MSPPSKHRHKRTRMQRSPDWMQQIRWCLIPVTLNHVYGWHGKLSSFQYRRLSPSFVPPTWSLWEYDGDRSHLAHRTSFGVAELIPIS